MSIPCMDRLTYDEDGSVIYVTYYPWIIDMSEDIICKWPDGPHRDALLDSPQVDKYRGNTLVFSESKYGINDDIFKLHEYYGEILQLGCVE